MSYPAADSDVQDGNYYAVGDWVPRPMAPLCLARYTASTTVHVVLTQTAQGLVEYAALPAHL